MKKLLISLPLLLMFITSLTFARSNRFDSNIYNQCVQYYQTQRHNAEAQAGNLWFSKRWVEYLNSLPTDEEIEEQCEYNAENRQDDDTFYRWQNLWYQAVMNWNYADAISYYEKALYYVPVGSQMYNAVESAIQEIKQYEQSSQQFNNWSYYYNLWVDAWKNYKFDDAIKYFENALKYTNVWTQEYYGTQNMISEAKKLKNQQEQINNNSNKTYNNSTNGEDVENYSYYYKLWAKEIEKGNYDKWLQYYEKSKEFLNKGSELYTFTDKIIESKKAEYWDNYYLLWIKEMEKYNYDEAIEYFEKSLKYEDSGSQRYTWTKDIIKKIKDARTELDKEKEAVKNTGKESTTNTTNKTNTQNYTTQTNSITKDEELKIAIQWMYDNWLTIYNQVQDFLPNDEITREQASKFFVEFAAKVLWKDRWIISSYNSFSDISKANPTLKDHIIYANNMWLFKWTNWKFNPFNKLTKAQAIAVTIRMANWYMDENFNPRYFNYYYTADSYWILKWWWFEFDTLDKQNISRWDMALILYNLYLYLNNKYLTQLQKS